MLVKKIKQDWSPSEKPDIKVGEIIDITNPKELILSGIVVGIDSDGGELSPYDLYGVIVKKEREEFEEWLKMKKATAMRDMLMKEKEELEAKLEPEKKEEPVVAPTPGGDIKDKRLAALAKARAARAANLKK